MLSNLLELLAFTVLTYGSYVMGGRGPALFVAGFLLIILGLAADGISVNFLARSAWEKVRRIKPVQKKAERVRNSVLTNADMPWR